MCLDLFSTIDLNSLFSFRKIAYVSAEPPPNYNSGDVYCLQHEVHCFASFGNVFLLVDSGLAIKGISPHIVKQNIKKDTF